MEPQKPSRDSTEISMPPSEFSLTLAEEMVTTAEVFRCELTDPMIRGYKEALDDLSPEQLRRGFKRSRRLLTFFPKPSELRECAYEEFREFPPEREVLPEPIWTDADRKSWSQEMEKVREKLAAVTKSKTL